MLNSNARQYRSRKIYPRELCNHHHYRCHHHHHHHRYNAVKWISGTHRLGQVWKKMAEGGKSIKGDKGDLQFQFTKYLRRKWWRWWWWSWWWWWWWFGESKKWYQRRQGWFPISIQKDFSELWNWFTRQSQRHCQRIPENSNPFEVVFGYIRW